MSWRTRLEARRRRRQFLDEKHGQRLSIERAIVLWVLPLSILVGAGVALWVLRY